MNIAPAARSFAIRATASAGYRLTRLSSRLETAPFEQGETSETLLTLAGDRDVEWAWCLGHLRAEPGHILDFGAGHGLLSLAAAFRGHRVVAVDLEPRAFSFDHDGIDYRQGDLNQMELPKAEFHQVLNCSTVEHVGLAGRYGSADDADGDLRAMRTLAEVLRPDGEMVMTLPIGRDGIYAPYHRVYGKTRLTQLLEPFEVITEEFRAKQASSRWQTVDRETAIAVEGSASYYALGLFVLKLA